jgi:hypothetical protein
MTGRSFAKYLNPWALKAEKRQLRVDALRQRDGENCRRCRRPIRFDLPSGHDQAPKLEQILPLSNGEAQAISNLCLTHTRCNAEARDNTIEVQERAQLRVQTAARPRKRRKPAARAAA